MGILALLIALVARSRRAQVVALVLIVVSAASAWPVFIYGKKGYQRVHAMSDNDGQAWLDAHMHPAENLIYIYYLAAAAGFDGHGTRRDYYFKTRNGAREFRLRIKRWKAEQKSPADTLSFDDSDKRWLAYLRAHVGNLELLPAIVTHWERTAKPITRPLKVEELCKAFVLYRQSKGLDKATLSEDRYISKRLQKHLGGYMAHELGIAEIRSFLDTAKTSDSLEHKLYKVGSL